MNPEIRENQSRFNKAPSGVTRDGALVGQSALTSAGTPQRFTSEPSDDSHDIHRGGSQ